MGFFEALKRFLTHDMHSKADDEARQKLRDVWGLEGDNDSASATTEENESSTAYDRQQWRKKLRKAVEELPASRDRWTEMMTEAHALGFEPDWIADAQLEEFGFLIRTSVADRVISEEEHHRIDLARKVMEIQDTDAQKTLKSIMAEAESIFGQPVRDEG